MTARVVELCLYRTSMLYGIVYRYSAAAVKVSCTGDSCEHEMSVPCILSLCVTCVSGIVPKMLFYISAVQPNLVL